VNNKNKIKFQLKNKIQMNKIIVEGWWAGEMKLATTRQFNKTMNE